MFGGPKKNFKAGKRLGKLLRLLGGPGMLPQKIFKIKGPRLAKNSFPEISAWKN